MSTSQSGRSARRNATLTVEQLAHFATPKTWAEILTLAPRMTAYRWRRAILAADECGSGHLMWIRETQRKRRHLAPGDPLRVGAWTLTEKGRAYVARELARATPKPEASPCPGS